MYNTGGIVATDIQIIYILTNPSMPGLIKVGVTGQTDVESRMKQLYTTGVPVPFECNYACKVKNSGDAEKALHFAFGDSRVNPNREFFKIPPERVVAVLKLLQLEEVTIQVNKEIESETDEEDRQSSARLKIRSRRPVMNFFELSVPIGSILKFRDSANEVTVVNERRVTFQGEEMSLTAATRKILDLAQDYPLQPSPYWSFNGKSLYELYDEYHSEEEAA